MDKKFLLIIGIGLAVSTLDFGCANANPSPPTHIKDAVKGCSCSDTCGWLPLVEAYECMRRCAVSCSSPAL